MEGVESEDLKEKPFRMERFFFATSAIYLRFFAVFFFATFFVAFFIVFLATFFFATFFFAAIDLKGKCAMTNVDPLAQKKFLKKFFENFLA